MEGSQRVLGAVALQSLIGPDIDAFPLIRILLAPSFEASAAGSVPLVFCALAGGTQVGEVRQRAVAALLTFVGDLFRDVFQACEPRLNGGPVHRLREGSHGFEQDAALVEDHAVKRSE